MELESILDRMNSKIQIISGNIDSKIGKGRAFKRQLTIIVYIILRIIIDRVNYIHKIQTALCSLIKISTRKKLMLPDNTYSNQIDHMLINDKFANNITNYIWDRTYRWADYDIDHFLVVSYVTVKLKAQSKMKKHDIVRYDTDKLIDKQKCR